MNFKTRKSEFEAVKRILCSLGNTCVLCDQHLTLFLRFLFAYFIVFLLIFNRKCLVIEMLLHAAAGEFFFGYILDASPNISTQC